MFRALDIVLPRRLACIGALGAAALLCVALSAHAATSSGAPCGPHGAASAVDAIDDGIAHEIYAQELASARVSDDLARITSSSALAAAVASGNRAQIKAATHAIVYTPVWHIVRLRVLSPSGQVLADVGGPYIVAPVTGQITFNGKTVGTFVMSVQDDRGYKKLVSHITGAGVELYLNGKPLMGTLPRPPSRPPGSGSVRLAGVSYHVDAYSVKAFPTGSLQVAVLVPAPPAALAAMSCPAVKLATESTIVTNVATGLAFSGYNIDSNLGLFIQQAYGYAHVPVFVFADQVEVAGTDDLPGTTVPSAPSSLSPDTKLVSYDGSKWLVRALRPFPPDWIYVLAPAGSAAGATGPTGASGATGATDGQ